MKDKALYFNTSEGFLHNLPKNNEKNSRKIPEFHENIKSGKNWVIETKSDFSEHHSNFEMILRNFVNLHY